MIYVTGWSGVSWLELRSLGVCEINGRDCGLLFLITPAAGDGSLAPGALAPIDLLADRLPRARREERIRPARDHPSEHLVGDRKGDLIRLHELAVRGVPATQYGFELSL